MKIINLATQGSIINHFMAEMRDSLIQKDSMRFRVNLERIGSLFGYEISKQLEYVDKEVETPLGIASCKVLKSEVVIASILRAGLPLHNGVLSIFDKAQNAFVAAYRKYGNDNRFTIQVEYAHTPNLEGKILILVDSMLATGSSMDLTYQKLVEEHKPLHTHIICPIASSEGVEYLSKRLPHKEVTLWLAAVDEELTIKSYIVPGLGDAGDLAFGSK